MSEALLAPPAASAGLTGRRSNPSPITVSLAARQIEASRPALLDRAATATWSAVAPDCQPAPHHRWKAGARLRMRLISSANPDLGPCSDDAAAAALVGDSASRQQLADAAASLAATLGLQEADIVLNRLDRLALEAASVEALRENLVEPAKHALQLLARQRCSNAETQAKTRQAGLLLIATLSDIRTRLQDADEATADIIPALTNIETSIARLRSCCAGLVRRYPGLMQVLAGWTGTDLPAGFATALASTHAFLVAQSMRQTSQFSEGRDDRLDQICPIRNTGKATLAISRNGQ